MATSGMTTIAISLLWDFTGWDRLNEELEVVIKPEHESSICDGPVVVTALEEVPHTPFASYTAATVPIDISETSATDVY